MKLKQTLLGLALTAALVLPASAANVLEVNGKNLWSQAQAHLVEGGTTYVSLRTITEALAPNAAVSWRTAGPWCPCGCWLQPWEDRWTGRPRWA